MNADELKQLADQCLELAQSIPGNRAPFTRREEWWKRVRVLLVGPLSLDHLPPNLPLEPSERSDLRDALQEIALGKNIKNNEPDPGPCGRGLETAGELLRRAAGRMPRTKAWSRDLKVGTLLGVAALLLGFLAWWFPRQPPPP